MSISRCGEKETSTDKDTSTKSEEKEINTKKSKYFADLEMEYKLRMKNYSINIPMDTKDNCDTLFIFFVMNNKQGNTINVTIRTKVFF